MNNENEIFAMWNWQNYNSYGDEGPAPTQGFVSIDEAREYAEEYADSEPFVADIDNWMNFPESSDINMQNVETLCDQMEKWLELDEWERKIAEVLAEHYDFDEALDKVDDCWAIDADSYEELAQKYLDELGVDELQYNYNYVDYDAWIDDIRADEEDYFRSEVYDVDEDSEDWDEDEFESAFEDYLDDIRAQAEDDPKTWLGDYIENYFDYERFGRELSWDAYEGDGIYVFGA